MTQCPTQGAGPPRVLFICTHNSARSQMAEGLLRHLSGGQVEAHSAGTEVTGVRPLALRAMDELGIDISAHQSKYIYRFLTQHFHFVITVCDHAAETCPLFPGSSQRLHWSFVDPSKGVGTEEEQLALYRHVRDQIRRRIERELLPMLGITPSVIP